VADEPVRVATDPRAAGPTVLRMVVGAQLRRFREAAGISTEAAGYEIRDTPGGAVVERAKAYETVDPNTIKDIKIIRTVTGGRVVYEA